MLSKRPASPSPSASGFTHSRMNPSTAGSASMRSVCGLGQRTKRCTQSVSVAPESSASASFTDRLVALAEHLAHLLAVDLVGAGKRQLVDDEHDARMREAGAALQAKP